MITARKLLLQDDTFVSLEEMATILPSVPEAIQPEIRAIGIALRAMRQLDAQKDTGIGIEELNLFRITLHSAAKGIQDTLLGMVPSVEEAINTVDIATVTPMALYELGMEEGGNFITRALDKISEKIGRMYADAKGYFAKLNQSTAYLMKLADADLHKAVACVGTPAGKVKVNTHHLSLNRHVSPEIAVQGIKNVEAALTYVFDSYVPGLKKVLNGVAQLSVDVSHSGWFGNKDDQRYDNFFREHGNAFPKPPSGLQQEIVGGRSLRIVDNEHAHVLRGELEIKHTNSMQQTTAEVDPLTIEQMKTICETVKSAAIMLRGKEETYIQMVGFSVTAIKKLTEERKSGVKGWMVEKSAVQTLMLLVHLWNQAAQHLFTFSYEASLEALRYVEQSIARY